MTTIENTAGTLDSSLRESVAQKVKGHLLVLDDRYIVDLYKLVMEEIEAPLLKAVIEHCKYNQCRAAILLGVSRGTLRTRLQYYFDDKYIGTRV